MNKLVCAHEQAERPVNQQMSDSQSKQMKKLVCAHEQANLGHNENSTTSSSLTQVHNHRKWDAKGIKRPLNNRAWKTDVLSPVSKKNKLLSLESN